jgi:hypothetical protein
VNGGEQICRPQAFVPEAGEENSACWFPGKIAHFHRISEAT